MECWSNLLIFLLLLTLTMHAQSAPTSRRSRAAAISEEEPTTTIENNQEEPQGKSNEEGSTSSPVKRSNRRNKALNLFGYYPSFLSSGLDYSDDDNDDIVFGVNDDHIDEDDLSRTIPSRRQQQNKKKNGNGNTFQNDQINSLQYDNSPIFFIRLPPTPYMFVPGLGYVSQPPSLGPPMSAQIPQGIPPQVSDPFINLPLDFVSNGKPIGVYQWNGAPGYSQAPQVPQVPQMSPFGYGPSQPLMPPVQQPNYNVLSYKKPKPKPVPSNSKVTNLKGQYLFNGKPGDSVYVLRDTYNSIYSDALQNFYP